MDAVYVPANAAGIVQVYVADTELNAGPVFVLQVVGPPERPQVGVPVGATDPGVPVIVAVNVID